MDCGRGWIDGLLALLDHSVGVVGLLCVVGVVGWKRNVCFKLYARVSVGWRPRWHSLLARRVSAALVPQCLSVRAGFSIAVRLVVGAAGRFWYLSTRCDLSRTA